jgi:hypothetical protein
LRWSSSLQQFGNGVSDAPYPGAGKPTTADAHPKNFRDLAAQQPKHLARLGA